jgi:Methyltransferase domain
LELGGGRVVHGVMHALKMPFRRIKRRVLLEINLPTNFGKTDIVHLLSKRLKLRNYLEICTTTTGNFYCEINRPLFSSSRRLMYNCPETFDDGLPIDFRIESFDIDSALSELAKNSNKVDICLVDGWHTYSSAIRDLTCGYNLLSDGGAIVVHDCLPPSESIASPNWLRGEWCGVSYKAFLDFVLARDDLDYCVVDVDYGCGIIIKNRKLGFVEDTLSSNDKSKLVADWFSVHEDEKAAFQFFMENHKSLLRLISAKAFVRSFNRASVQPIWSVDQDRGTSPGYKSDIPC